MKSRIIYFSIFSMIVGLVFLRPAFVDSYILHNLAFLKTPEIDYRLGHTYFKGAGIDQNLKQAEAWYLKAAERGHAKAMYKLGNLYSHRYGMEKGLEKHPEFWRDIPLDYQKALKWYKLAAEKKYAPAYVRLGYFNVDGVGTPVDYPQSFMWYRKAAKAGEMRSQAWLGYFYLHGIDREDEWKNKPNRWNNIEKNYAKALKWYERSAKQGLDNAQYMTGFLYTNGEIRLGRGPLMYSFKPLILPGIPLDYEKAAYWYKKAAKQQYPPAMRLLGYFCYRGNYAVERNLTMAFSWYLKAAFLGDSTSMRHVGSCYEDGTGVLIDNKKALEWYHKASDHGDSTAKYYIEALNTKISHLLPEYSQ